MPMEPTELRAALEAILFVSNEPVKLDELAEAFAGEGREAVIEQLEEIKRALDAYRQPITAPEVSEIRGVNSNQTIRTLLERRMIRVAGRKNVVGSPFLYRTTREFLVHFGLNDIRDMPRLEEFGDLIGESINEDLVAAIETAPQTSETDVTEPATSEEAAAIEAAALDELARGEVQSSHSSS